MGLAFRRLSGFGLLREPDFRQLFMADTASLLGTQVSLLALPLTAVLLLKAQPVEVGLLAACDMAGFLLVGLPAGALVDRLRRRPVLIVSDLGRTLVIASVPLAWWAGVLSMPQLYGVALGAGVLTVFFDVAYQSYLPHLVGRDNLVEANAKLESVRAVTDVAGPGLAGYLIQALTAPVAIAVDAASFTGSAVLVSRIRKREPVQERAPETHLGREIGEGLRFVLGNRLLRSIAACTGSYLFFSSLSGAMLIVLLARELGLTPGIIGLIFSVGSLGALLGAFAARRLSAWLGQGPTIWISVAATAPFGLLLPIAQRGWLVWTVTLSWAVTSFGVVVYNIVQVAFRQGLTPERLLGRMNATMRFLAWGTMPLGSLLGGVLGQAVGLRPAILIGVTGTMLAFLPTFFSPLRSMRELPAHQVQQTQLP